jgi:tricorn protease
MNGRLVCLLLFVLMTGSLGSAAAATNDAYFRYPDLNNGQVVFCAEADLWIVSDQGGAARRLTTHEGNEYYPRFSPDGKQIAFTGQYDGNRDIYVISSEGGEPRRITWHPGSDEMVEWTPDGKSLIFRSRSEQPSGSFELFMVPAAGGDPEKLPLGWASRIDVDPATGRWAFNRKERENATWKRYRGGTAPDIWVGDPARADYKQITDFDGINAFPMWHGGRIYFLSDQGGTMNIWSIAPDGADRQRHTDFKDWDARWPGMAPDGRIAFTLGADIQIFDPAANSVRKLEVALPSDRVLTRTRYPAAGQYLTYFDLSPDGDRLAVTARGEVFSVPVKEGVTLPVTHGSGARESWASFDPKGERLVYVTDEPREEEIRVIDSWGRGAAETVKPAGTSGWHFPPRFSPDGAWIAYADQTQTLYVIPAKGGSPRQVDHSDQEEIRDYTWSPDGRWLAYSKQFVSEYSSVFIYDVTKGETHQVTGPNTADRSPAWDPDGRYLYFLSDRCTNPVIGTGDYQNIEVRNTRPYMVLLRPDVKNPFVNLEGLPPAGDDQKDAAKDAKKSPRGRKDNDDENDEKKDDEAIKPVEIDFKGLADRVLEIDVERGSYFGLAATSGKVFYLSAPVKGMAEYPGMFDEGGPENTLMAFDLEEKEAEPFLEGVTTYALAAKKGKLAVMKDRGEIYVVDAGSAPSDLGKAKVSLSDVVIELDPREEWEQIYYEGWRHMRDFYWDPGMGGLDWKAIRDRYAVLLPRLANRSDLQDLMGELIGELNTSHTYVFGGDPGTHVGGVPTGLLGADLKREGTAYRIERIYRGDPADTVRSPLQDPGANISEGDYILAVNNTAFDPGRPFYSYLAQMAGKEVVLTVNGRPTTDGARQVVITPLRSEGDLRYSDWVRRNREYVAEKSGGKIGYIHVPDMWTDGLIEFNTWFYPQLDKEGMVVDMRWNGGGSVSQQILERFRRPVVSFDRARGGGVYTYPSKVLNGPFVVLTNEFAGSDGDIFPMAVQLEGLAPVIGMRSWGGVVGIRGDKLLVDGGFLTQPEFAWWDARGGWALENRGVIPDIEVQNLPQELAKGTDAQLDRGIAEVLKLHQAHPPLRPDFGPVPSRTRKAYGRELPGGN